MKNKILILLMICAIMIVGGGCTIDFDKQRIPLSTNPNNRFQPTVDVFVTPSGYQNIVVLEDTKTGILYLCTSGGGITPWLDENGEPMKAEKGGGH